MLDLIQLPVRVSRLLFVPHNGGANDAKLAEHFSGDSCHPTRSERFRTTGLFHVQRDIAFEKSPSRGTRIHKNLLSNLKYDDIHDFVGSCNFVTLEANVGPGYSGTGVWFIGGAVSGAYGALSGMQAGLPGAGISLCVGAVAGTR